MQSARCSPLLVVVGLDIHSRSAPRDRAASGNGHLGHASLQNACVGAQNASEARWTAAVEACTSQLGLTFAAETERRPTNWEIGWAVTPREAALARARVRLPARTWRTEDEKCQEWEENYLTARPLLRAHLAGHDRHILDSGLGSHSQALCGGVRKTDVEGSLSQPQQDSSSQVPDCRVFSDPADIWRGSARATAGRQGPRKHRATSVSADGPHRTAANTW